MSRHNRASAVLALVAMAAAIFAVCPCLTGSGVREAADAHSCCRRATRSVIAPDPGSCCDDGAEHVSFLASAPAAIAPASVSITSTPLDVSVDPLPPPAGPVGPPRTFRVLRM